MEYVIGPCEGDYDRPMTYRWRRRKLSNRQLLEAILATVEEVQAALQTLTADLEGLATAAKAEFAKLEEELSSAPEAPNLTPLKESIEAIDAKVKAAGSSVPTN